jgi:predicted double-glycine peptidase
MRIIALAFLLCVASVIEAAQMPLSVLPGGAVVFKPIQSIRERKFADLVQQKTDFSCGAAALATILRQAYWLDVTEDQIIEGMLAHADQDLVRVQGFSMLDMKRYVESIGMRARGYRVAPETLGEIKIPVVVLMDIRGYKHFVVMQRVHEAGSTSGIRCSVINATKSTTLSKAGTASSSPSSVRATTKPMRCSIRRCH